MSRSVPTETIFHVDREHKGVRVAVIATLFVSFGLAFIALNYILQVVAPEISTTVILACLGALPIGLTLSALGEWHLKRSWHSGRMIVVDVDCIALELPEEENKRLDRQKTINQLWWHIPLAGYARGGRERRIPSKWSCVAGQLQQDETRVVAFCYARPSRLERWRERYNFARLNPEDVYKTSYTARYGSPMRPELPPEVIAGRQGRFWLAERNRWREGVELTQDDFEELMGLVRSDST